MKRGIPFRYQQSVELFPHNSLTDAQVESWQGEIGLRVTHTYWLAIDALLAMTTVALIACSIEYWLRRELSQNAG